MTNLYPQFMCSHIIVTVIVMIVIRVKCEQIILIGINRSQV